MFLVLCDMLSVYTKTEEIPAVFSAGHSLNIGSAGRGDC